MPALAPPPHRTCTRVIPPTACRTARLPQPGALSIGRSFPAACPGAKAAWRRRSARGGGGGIQFQFQWKTGEWPPSPHTSEGPHTHTSALRRPRPATPSPAFLEPLAFLSPSLPPGVRPASLGLQCRRGARGPEESPQNSCAQGSSLGSWANKDSFQGAGCAGSRGRSANHTSGRRHRLGPRRIARRTAGTH